MSSANACLFRLFYLQIISFSICSSAGFANTPLRILTRHPSGTTSTSTSTNASSEINSLVSSPIQVISNNRHFHSKTALFERKKNASLPRKWQKASSILRLLPGFSSKEKGYRRFDTKNDTFQTGLEAALVLGNQERRAQWTKDVGKKFSWIPPEMLSMCIDGLASAFVAVAPKDLQKALQPGGLEKVRSKVEADFVRHLQNQPMVRQLPMAQNDKDKLVAYLVNLSLAYFLKDLESALEAPSEKLRHLDRERREIQRYMSVRQLVWYRLWYKPATTIAVAFLSIWTICITFLFLQQNHNKTIVIIQQQISLLFSFLAGAFIQWISIVRSAWRWMIGITWCRWNSPWGLEWKKLRTMFLKSR